MTTMMTQLDFAPAEHDLLAENLQLREHLANLLDQAHSNQKIMRRLQTFDLQLIAANNLTELIDTLFQELAKTSELELVTLVLVDAEHEIQRVITDLGFDINAYPSLLFVQHARELGYLYKNLDKPILGSYSPHRHGVMFPAHLSSPASVAILPLLRQEKLIGFLNLGSRHAGRFSATMATDFIERLAQVVAICIDNVINNERLRHIGLTDPLTGVNNRRYVEQRLHEEVSRASRQHYTLSCMYIDIDHFKKINDTYGHQSGDDVLCIVAERIKAELRLSDTLGRFGGEEFVVLLINADLSAAACVAERIRASIADLPISTTAEEELTSTVSIGVASITPETGISEIETTAQQLIAAADQALYQAKQTGRNRVVVNHDVTLSK